MEIRLNTNIDSVPRVSEPRRGARAENALPVDGFARSHALEGRLAEVPDTRPEKVERARDLIGDPAYPPNEAMNGLANLLALKMETLPEEL